MGETIAFQPLTRRDKISVVLYRAGIALITALVLALAAGTSHGSASPAVFGAAVALLHVSAGLSVFFIHLYVGKFHRALKKLYLLSVLCALALFALGRGDALSVITGKAYGPLLLMPLAGCIGFVTAKEAFCFKLLEGYVIALILPMYLLLLSSGALSPSGASQMLWVIALLLALFMVRKVFMPLHYDIGDKSAYR